MLGNSDSKQITLVTETEESNIWNTYINAHKNTN